MSMTTIDLVTEKMQYLPQEKQEQILDFVEFLTVKYQQELKNHRNKPQTHKNEGNNFRDNHCLK